LPSCCHGNVGTGTGHEPHKIHTQQRHRQWQNRSIMTYDVILINGDSYTAPTTRHSVYGDWLSKKLNIPVVNLAIPGANNERILRSSVEYLEKTKYKNPFVIVGWSFIRRLEVWYYGNNKNVLKRIPDNNTILEEHIQLKFVTLDWLLEENEATVEQKSLINEDLFVHKQLTNFYTDLYLFSNLLKYKNLKYFFFSAAKNNEILVHCFPAIQNLNIVKKIEQDENIYKLHDFYVQQWAESNDSDAHPITGHLSAAGHTAFADFLLKILSF